VLERSQVQHWEKRLVRNWQYRSGRSQQKHSTGARRATGFGTLSGTGDTRASTEPHSEQCSGQHSVSTGPPEIALGTPGLGTGTRR
jgi:hypothetical protein